MEETILRRDVVAALDTGESFDMIYVTCDRRRGTGGDLIGVCGWLRLSNEERKANKTGTYLQEPAAEEDSRSANHHKHGTVNIYNPANKGVHPHKVHVDLIQFFNGKRVTNG